MGLARLRTRDVPDPIHEALEIDRQRGGQMMPMGLLQAPIPYPSHAQGQGSWREGAFDAGSPFVVSLTTLGVLTFARCLERSMLRFGMEGEASCLGFAAGTASPHLTCRAILAIQCDLEGRLAEGALRWCPGPTGFAHGTEDSC